MVMKFLGKIISFILSLILLIGELVMHVFIGMQILLMINERSVVEQYLGLFAGYFKSSFFMEYYNLLLNPLVRTAFYVLIIIIIILIIAFNNRIALSLREIGLVTFITSIPFLLLSLGWLSLDGIIPADRMEQYRKFFHAAFHTSSLVALAIGAALYLSER